MEKDLGSCLSKLSNVGRINAATVLRGISVGQQIGSRFAPLGGCWLTSNWVCFSLAAWAQLGVSGVSTVQKCFSGEPLGTGETWVLYTEPPSLPPNHCRINMRGTRHLVSGHVNASLRTFKRSATSKSYKSLESEVLRLPTSAPQR